MQVSDVAFDMNKYFQAMWIAVALLAAWFIRRWPWPAIGLVLVLSVPVPLLVAGWTASSREQVLDWNNVEAANWIAANTPDRAVFATDGWLNIHRPMPGRLRLITYTPYIANLGFDPDMRDERCARSTAPATCATPPPWRQLGATYLLDSGRPSDCARPRSSPRVRSCTRSSRTRRSGYGS